MKKIAVLLSLIICFSFVSCDLYKNLPDKVVINEKEYTRAFVAELYPMQEGFPDANAKEIKLSGVSYYQYPSSFECYIAYDLNAEPNVYFESDKYDDAVSYYSSAENFDFFCLFGNIHDENEQVIYSIPGTDLDMFDSLIDFSRENDYNLLTSFNNDEGLKSVPVSDPDNWMADEIHIYKESRDGAFTTLKSHTFLLLENKLFLLYQYNFTDEKSPVMLVREVPTEISDYFCNLIESLHNR